LYLSANAPSVNSYSLRSRYVDELKKNISSLSLLSLSPPRRATHLQLQSLHEKCITILFFGKLYLYFLKNFSAPLWCILTILFFLPFRPFHLLLHPFGNGKAILNNPWRKPPGIIRAWYRSVKVYREVEIYQSNAFPMGYLDLYCAVYVCER